MEIPSTADLQPFLDAAPDALVVVNSASRIVAANDAAERLFGYAPGELRAAPLSRLVPESARAAHEHHVADFHATPRHRRMGRGQDLEARRKDGSTFPAEISLRPIEVDGRHFVVSAIRDVTEERRRREELRQNRARWRRLVERNRDPILVVIEGRIAYVNPAGAQVLGGEKPGDIVGQSIFEFKDPGQGRAQLRARLRCVYGGEATDPWEHAITRIDGEKRIVETYSMPIEYDGQPAAQTVMHDRTEKRAAEERLRQSEARYRTLVEAAPEAIVVADPETGRLVDVNQAACDFFGCSRGALIGQHQRALHPDDLAEAAVQEFETFVATAREQKTARVQAFPVRRAGRDDGLADITGRLTELGGRPVVFAFFQDVTERVHRERELRIHRQRLQEAQRIAHLGHWVWDMQKGTLEWSDEVYRIFGVEPDAFEPTYERFLSMVHPDDRAAIEEGVESRNYQVEHRVVRPDGEIRVVEERGQVTRRDDAGEPAEMTGTVLDVTERRRIEDRVEEAQRIAQFGYWTIVPESKEATWSDELYRMMGYEPGAFEPTLEDCMDAVHPADRKRADQFLERILRDGGPHHSEMRLVKQDGTVRHIEARGARSHVDEQGRTYITGTHFDITERKQAEAELTQKRELLEALFDAIPVMITMYDPELKQVQINQEFERVLGWSGDDASLQDLMAACFPDLEQRRAAIEFMSEPGGGWRDFTMHTKSGDTIPTSWTNIRLSDATQVGIGIDLSERKRLESQLRQVQKMEMVGTLAGGVAHDFNNILHAVGAYLHLTRDSLPGDSSEQDYLDRADRGLQRAKKLVNQLMTFSRQEEVEDRQPVPVAEEVSEVVDLARPTLPPDTDLRVNLEEAPHVLGDPDQLQQVLMNLLTNAAHALGTTDSEARRVLDVQVRAVAVDDEFAARDVHLHPGSYVRITVGDTGPGIDSATQERIFEPFFTTKDVGEGTGLGLSVVHGIVRGHDGAVTVYSEPGEGTTFHVFLPAMEEVESDDPAAPAPEPDLPPVDGTRLLVVDDNPDIVEVEAERLRQMGCDVTACLGPKAALEQFRDAPDAFDAVLTDYTMPHMNGLELIGALREVRSALPAMLFSGFSAQVDSTDLRAAGVDAFLHKPVPQNDLRRALHELISTRNASTS